MTEVYLYTGKNEIRKQNEKPQSQWTSADWLEEGIRQGVRNTLDQMQKVPNICVHCGKEARCFIQVSELVPLCFECAGLFITKGLPKLEQSVTKLAQFIQQQEGKDGKPV